MQNTKDIRVAFQAFNTTAADFRHRLHMRVDDELLPLLRTFIAQYEFTNILGIGISNIALTCPPRLPTLSPNPSIQKNIRLTIMKHALDHHICELYLFKVLNDDLRKEYGETLSKHYFMITTNELLAFNPFFAMLDSSFKGTIIDYANDQMKHYIEDRLKDNWSPVKRESFHDALKRLKITLNIRSLCSSSLTMESTSNINILSNPQEDPASVGELKQIGLLKESSLYLTASRALREKSTEETSEINKTANDLEQLHPDVFNAYLGNVNAFWCQIIRDLEDRSEPAAAQQTVPPNIPTPKGLPQKENSKMLMIGKVLALTSESQALNPAFIGQHFHSELSEIPDDTLRIIISFSPFSNMKKIPEDMKQKLNTLIRDRADLFKPADTVTHEELVLDDYFKRYFIMTDENITELERIMDNQSLLMTLKKRDNTWRGIFGRKKLMQTFFQESASFDSRIKIEEKLLQSNKTEADFFSDILSTINQKHDYLNEDCREPYIQAVKDILNYGQDKKKRTAYLDTIADYFKTHHFCLSYYGLTDKAYVDNIFSLLRSPCLSANHKKVCEKHIEELTFGALRHVGFNIQSNRAYSVHETLLIASKDPALFGLHSLESIPIQSNKKSILEKKYFKDLALLFRPAQTQSIKLGYEGQRSLILSLLLVSIVACIFSTGVFQTFMSFSSLGVLLSLSSGLLCLSSIYFLSRQTQQAIFINKHPSSTKYQSNQTVRSSLEEECLMNAKHQFKAIHRLNLLKATVDKARDQSKTVIDWYRWLSDRFEDFSIIKKERKKEPNKDKLSSIKKTEKERSKHWGYFRDYLLAKLKPQDKLSFKEMNELLQQIINNPQAVNDAFKQKITNFSKATLAMFTGIGIIDRIDDDEVKIQKINNYFGQVRSKDLKKYTRLFVHHASGSELNMDAATTSDECLLLPTVK